MTISEDSMPMVTDDALSADLSGEVVILNVARGVYYGLQEVGHIIWKGVEDGKTVGEIISDVMNEFDVELEQCRADVIDLLTDLEKEGLIRIT